MFLLSLIYTCLFLFKSQTKKGPPNIAVIIPTGISVGARSILASVSQATRKLAPKSMHAGISIRRSGPTNNRTIWGTINPTKPMGPEVATTVPVMSEAVMKPTF
jgi:hypothetical protein